MRTFICLITITLVAGADWPRFRGPDGLGVAADDAAYPVEWGEGKNIRWKAELPGKGLSSPVVYDGRVVVTSCTGFRQDRLHVFCFDQKTGEERWHRQLWATGSTQCNPKTNMAAPTPVIDETGVYALFATGDLAAFDLDGNLRWYRSLVGDYPEISNQIGMASSPIVWRDRLILPLTNAGDSFLAALDTQYGRNVWRVDRPRETNWITPSINRRDGRDELLYQTRDRLVAYSPSDGKELWTFDGKGMSSMRSTVATDDKILVTAAGVTILDSKVTNDGPKELWQSNRLAASYSIPLLYKGSVYNVNNSGVLVCLDPKTGDPRWQERIGGNYVASVVAADGKIYLVDESGKCSVVKVDGEDPELLATNRLDQEILATPALADGMIFIRSDSTLWCIE